MKKSKSWLMLFAVAACLLLLTAVGSQAGAAGSPSLLTAASEAAVQGGRISCDRMVGLTVGLAIGALSPCSILCAVASFYSLAAMGFMGC